MWAEKPIFFLDLFCISPQIALDELKGLNFICVGLFLK